MTSDQDKSQDLLLSVHQQFAENQRTREGLFVSLLPLLGGVVGAYAYVFQGYHNDPGIFALATIAGQLLLVFSAWLVCVLAHNFRRDQSVNARIRHEFGVIGIGAIYPIGYDPALTLGTRRFFFWMPDFYSLFYSLFLTVQVLLLASYAYRAELSFNLSRSASVPGTTTVSVSVIAILASTMASPLYYRKILVQLDLLRDVSPFRFLLSGLWMRVGALRRHIGQQQEIRAKFWEAFRTSSELSRNAGRIISRQHINSHLHSIVVYHVVRANSLLRSITASCEAGYATEAMILLRSLFYLELNLRWLLAGETDTKVQRFADFEVVRSHILKTVLSRHGIHPINDLGTEQFQVVVKKYGLSSDEELMYWTGLSPSGIAEELGLKDVHELITTRVLDYDLTSPGVTKQYLEMTEDGLVIRWASSEENVEFVMRDATQRFATIMRYFLQVFSVQAPALQRLIEKNEKIYAEFVMRENARMT